MYRKSSYSESGNCVEVDAIPGFRKSSYSKSGNCVEVDTIAEFRKSSYSASANCVETASGGERRVLVRDSKNITQPPLQFTGDAWSRFLGSLKGA